jgi:O-antigen/teichoic acid export membrane protein
MFCVVFFSLALAATAGDMVSIMAERSYFDAWQVVPVVLLGFFAWASVNIFEIGVLLEKKTYYRTFSCLIGAICAIVTYALFIPRWGVMGAAWATVCSFFAMAVSMWIFSNRLHPIPYDLRRTALIIVLAGGVYILTRLLPGYGNMPILIARISIVMLFPGLLYLIGYFEPKNIESAKSAVNSFISSLPWCRSNTPSSGGGGLE